LLIRKAFSRLLQLTFVDKRSVPVFQCVFRHDVACGTGVLAREAAHRVGPHGAVAGLDLNEDMLGVARTKTPEIEWRQGRAEALPFEDASFDAVLSQFGLIFFEDRPGALCEKRC